MLKHLEEEVLVQTVLAEENVLAEIKNKEKIKQNQRNKLFSNYIFLKIYVIFENLCYFCK